MKMGEILDRLDHAEDTGRIGRAVVRAIRDQLHAGIDNRIRLEKELAFFQGLAEHAPKLALDLECMCLDPNGWYETAIESVCRYKGDLEALFPQDPTYMGEPVLCGCQDCTKTTQNSVSA